MNSISNEPLQAVKSITEGLDILSWNVQDIKNQTLGDKTLLTEFYNVISKGIIVCLQETKEIVHMKDYKCYNSNRTESRSGGLCTAIHRSVDSKNVKIIPCDSPDILAVKIPKSALKFHKDLIVVNVYDSQTQSSYKKKKIINEDYEETLDSVLELLMNQKGCETVLVGDFNARTGNKNNTLVNDSPLNIKTGLFKSCPDMQSLALRSSKDKVMNDRGKCFLDMLEIANLSILNGSSIGDCMGEYTCLQYNGSSIPDYIALSKELKNLTLSFKVLNMTQYSDHRPLICSVNINVDKIESYMLENLYDDAPKKPKWNGDISINEFLKAQEHADFKLKLDELLDRLCTSENDVHSLNSDVVDLYHMLAGSVIVKGHNTDNRPNQPKKNKNQKNNGKRPKKKWFDQSCIILKRELNKLAKNYGKRPLDDNIRTLYYKKKKMYKNHIKKKKYQYFKEINYAILQEGQISWKDFSKLKAEKINESNLDLFDLDVFYNFFKKLYEKRDLSSEYKNTAGNNITIETEFEEILNSPINSEEITTAIRGLQNGKAIGNDRMINEFLKASKAPLIALLEKLFNSCLDQGIYPWNINLISPLHKRGCPHDPDNNRAIAVGSNLGKLFSTILLARLNKFRAIKCPDSDNQQGFCKNAQTSDHIFTLSTCIEKYTKTKNTRIFSCFVDFHKAFDTISREALLYKLHELGIRGKFFDCLKYMYSHSKARLRMVKNYQMRSTFWQVQNKVTH